jgi:hypothetical protein
MKIQTGDLLNMMQTHENDVSLVESMNNRKAFFLLLVSFLAVSQILDSLEDTQWLTIGDRLELDFLQKLFEDKQLRTLLEVLRIIKQKAYEI